MPRERRVKREKQRVPCQMRVATSVALAPVSALFLALECGAGTRQLVVFALALLTDDPTAGRDPVGRRRNARHLRSPSVPGGDPEVGP